MTLETSNKILKEKNLFDRFYINYSPIRNFYYMGLIDIPLKNGPQFIYSKDEIEDRLDDLHKDINKFLEVV